MDFSTGGLLIGGRPKCLLIRGDHLFLNYMFFLAVEVDESGGVDESWLDIIGNNME